MSQSTKRDSCSSSGSNDFNNNKEPPHKYRVIDKKITDVLIPVNPVIALKNLMPNLVFKSQSPNSHSQVYVVCAAFGDQYCEATDPFDSKTAMTKLARQILHSFIVDHSFVENITKSVSSIASTTHCARLLEGINDAVYIVGQQKRVHEPVMYSLYELKPGFKMTVTTKYTSNDPIAIPNYVAKVKVNGKKYFGSGNQNKLAEKEAIRNVLSSFTPENMFNLSDLMDPSQPGNKASITFQSSRAPNNNTPKQTEIHRSSAFRSNKKNKKLFRKKYALQALAFLKPQTKSVIIKTRKNSKGKTWFTARVTISGVNYDGSADSMIVALNYAAFNGLGNLSASKAEELAEVLPPNLLAGLQDKWASKQTEVGITNTKSVPNGSIMKTDSKYQSAAQIELHKKKDETIVHKKNLDSEKQCDADKMGSPLKCDETQKDLSQPNIAFITDPVKPGSTSENLNQDLVDEDHSFGDYIAEKVESVFKSLKNADSSIPPYKVLAGIVMSSGIAINGSQVICVATGDDSISGFYLSTKGEAINDCHAVILARRGLVCFLYDQLEKYGNLPEESIFEPAGNLGGLSRLKIKDEILFHLYVNSSPCEDECIQNNFGYFAQMTFRQPVFGSHYTKGFDGKTAPVSGAPIPTCHNFSKGKLLFTMPCSDKMARWNVVGTQGSLLSHLINPVYFHSVVIDNLLHPDSLRRAIIGRVEQLKDIPLPFVVMQPIIATTSGHRTVPAYTPKHSICWVKGWIQHESIDCINGKMMKKIDRECNLSKLCKRRFFRRFVSLASSNPGWSSLIQPFVESGRISYGKMKTAAEGFKKTNELLIESLVGAGLGRWVKKPVEQDLFYIEF